MDNFLITDQELHERTLLLSAALNERDNYSAKHCSRTAGLSLEIGRTAGINEHDARLLRIAANLHDIGKIGIPDSILLKPGTLDEEEWEIMKSHSERGQKILLEADFEFIHEVGDTIRHHHEHYDGSGYPDGLAGEEIPFLSRIITIADSYDALTTTRTYRDAKTHQEALAIMQKESKSMFDPHCFLLFLDLIEVSSYKKQ